MPVASAIHSAFPSGAPRGTSPAAIAGAVYFRIVLRSIPKLSAISACERPACQCTKISVTSITSLPLGPLHRCCDERTRTGPEDPARHAVVPLGHCVTQHLRNSVTPRVGNYVTRSARKLRNFMTAHSSKL